MKRSLPPLREPVSALTHWAGLAGALLLLGPLLGWAHSRGLTLWPFAVFALSLAGLYAASASYHSFGGSERGLRRLRRLDHAAIFVLIAGTYTPVAFFGLEGTARGALLGLIWGVALVGVLLKLLPFTLPRWVSTALYLGMGWLAALFLPQLARGLPSGALLWLAAGGLLYSAGAVVYATRRWNLSPAWGFHEIWHLFVLAGSGAHVAMMFFLR